MQAQNTEAFTVLLDENGNLCEGRGSNIFIVRDGVLMTPRERYVLPGVSRQTVMELAASEGIPCEEKDFDLFDAYNGDEFFITSTSFCVCPVCSINGSLFGDGSVPGPITERLMKAYVDLVGFDWISQYTRYPVADTPRA